MREDRACFWVKRLFNKEDTNSPRGFFHVLAKRELVHPSVISGPQTAANREARYCGVEVSTRLVLSLVLVKAKRRVFGDAKNFKMNPKVLLHEVQKATSPPPLFFFSRKKLVKKNVQRKVIKQNSVPKRKSHLQPSPCVPEGVRRAGVFTCERRV